ncbi:MAG: dockerin type I repeat-containing protein [Lachnospira sp.]|nr:dockerin type I repeat-containing protein [Lachnospira sp.]
MGRKAKRLISVFLTIIMVVTSVQLNMFGTIVWAEETQTTAVASVSIEGGEATEYTDVLAAFDAAQAAKSATVKLLKDTKITKLLEINAGDIVFDLNGKIFTVTTEKEFYGILVNDGKVKFMSSVSGGKVVGEHIYQHHELMWVEEPAIVDIDGVCFQGGGDDGSAIVNYGAITVSDATIENTGWCAIYNDDVGRLSINSGTFKGNDYAIRNVGVANIYGGTYSYGESGTAVFSNVPEASLTIEGGTFYGATTINRLGDTNYPGVVTVTGGSYPDGFAIAGAGTLKDILGGGAQFFDSDDTVVELADDQTAVTGKVYVSGAAEVASLTLKDGTVKTFSSLQGAFNAASENAGSTVKILNNILTETMAYMSKGDFNLDLNGKNLNYTGTAYDSAMIKISGGKLTIKDTGAAGSITAAELDAIYNLGGELVIEKGYISGPYSGIWNCGTLTVNGGTVEGGTSAILNSGVAVINSGSFKAVDIGTYYADIVNEGNMTIKGGTFKGEKTICDGDAANTYVAGGTYPNGFVIGGAYIADVLVEGANFYDSSNQVITITEEQQEITGSVRVQGAGQECVSVTLKDGTVSKYYTLKSAFGVAMKNAGSTVTLLADVDMAEKIDITEGDIIFDLNGKTISDTTNGISFTISYAKLYVTSSVAGGKIIQDCANSVYCAIDVEEGGYVNLGNVTLESTGASGWTVVNYGSLIVNGTTIKSQHSIPVISFETAQLIINDGTISGGDVGLVNKGTGIIKGGTIEYSLETDDANCAVRNIGTLVVEGGTFKGANAINRVTGTNMNSYIELAGGTFTSGLSLYEMPLKDALADGASYYDANGNMIQLTDEQTEVSGPVTVKGANNNVSVTLKNGSVTKFYSLQSAFAVAGENPESTVKLLGDITTSATAYAYKGDFTFDLNGKKLIYVNDDTENILQAVGIMDAKVKIISSDTGGTIDASATDADAIHNWSGEVVIDGATVKGGYTSVWNESLLTIESGNIIGSEYAIDNAGVTILNGGLYDCTYNAIVDNYGELHINGGIYNNINLVYNNTEDYYGELLDTDAVAEVKGGNYPNGFSVDNCEIADVLVEGYGVYDDKEQLITLEDGQQKVEGNVYVTKIVNFTVKTKDGTVTVHNSLREAFSEATKTTGSVITMVNDVTTSDTAYVYNGNFTLDLNGKKYVYVGTNSSPIWFEGAEVVIKSSVDGGTMDCSGSSSLTDLITNCIGTLTIESGTFIGKYSCIWNDGGTLVIEDGKFEAPDCVVDNIGKVIINGGTYEAVGTEPERAVIDNYGELVITGGTYSGTNTIRNNTEDYEGEALQTPATVKISGATFPAGYTISGITAKDSLAENADFYDAGGNVITLTDNQTAVEGNVTVKLSMILGDANSDGNISIADAVMLKQHLAGMNNTGINMDASDVNKDGRVNISDAVALMKYLAGDYSAIK